MSTDAEGEEQSLVTDQLGLLQPSRICPWDGLTQIYHCSDFIQILKSQ